MNKNVRYLLSTLLLLIIQSEVLHFLEDSWFMTLYFISVLFVRHYSLFFKHHKARIIPYTSFATTVSGLRKGALRNNIDLELDWKRDTKLGKVLELFTLPEILFRCVISLITFQMLMLGNKQKCHLPCLAFRKRNYYN